MKPNPHREEALHGCARLLSAYLAINPNHPDLVRLRDHVSEHEASILSQIQPRHQLNEKDLIEQLPETVDVFQRVYREWNIYMSGYELKEPPAGQVKRAGRAAFVQSAVCVS